LVDPPTGIIPGLTPEESVDVVEKILKGQLQPVIDGPAMRSDWSDTPRLARERLPASLQPAPSIHSEPKNLPVPDLRVMPKDTKAPPENPTNFIRPSSSESSVPSVTLNGPLAPPALSGLYQKSDAFLPPQNFIRTTPDSQLGSVNNISPPLSANNPPSIPFGKPVLERTPDDLADQRSAEPIGESKYPVKPIHLVDFQQPIMPIDALEEDLAPDELVRLHRTTVPIDETDYQILPDELTGPEQSNVPIVIQKELAPESLGDPQRLTVPTGEPGEKISPDEFTGSQRATPLKGPSKDHELNTFVDSRRVAKPIRNPVQDQTPDLVSRPSTAQVYEPVLFLSPDESNRPQRSTVPINQPLQDLSREELDNPHRSTAAVSEPVRDTPPDESDSSRRLRSQSHKPVQFLLPDDSGNPITRQYNAPMNEPLQDLVQDKPGGAQELTSLTQSYEPVQFLSPADSDGPQRSSLPMREPLQKPVKLLSAEESDGLQQSMAPANERSQDYPLQASDGDQQATWRTHKPVQIISPGGSDTNKPSAASINESAPNRAPNESNGPEETTEETHGSAQNFSPDASDGPQQPLIQKPIQVLPPDVFSSSSRSTAPVNEPLKESSPDDSDGSQRPTWRIPEPVQFLPLNESDGPKRYHAPAKEHSQDLSPGKSDSYQQLSSHSQPRESVQFLPPEDSKDPQLSTWHSQPHQPLQILSPKASDGPQQSAAPLDGLFYNLPSDELDGSQRSRYGAHETVQLPSPSESDGPQRFTVPIDELPVDFDDHPRSAQRIHGPAQLLSLDESHSSQRTTVGHQESLQTLEPPEIADPNRSTIPIDKPLYEPVPTELTNLQPSTVPLETPADNLVPSKLPGSLQSNSNPVAVDVAPETKPSFRHFPAAGGFLIPSQNIPFFLENGVIPETIHDPLQEMIPAGLPYVPQNGGYPLQDILQSMPQSVGYSPENLNMAPQGVPFNNPDYIVPAPIRFPQISPVNMQPIQEDPPLHNGELEQLTSLNQGIPENPPVFAGGNVPSIPGSATPGIVYVPAHQNGAVATASLSPCAISGPSVTQEVSQSQSPHVPIGPENLEANVKFIYKPPSYQGDLSNLKVRTPSTSTSLRPPAVGTTPKSNAGPSTIDPRIYFPSDSNMPSPVSPMNKMVQEQPRLVKELYKNFKNVDEDFLAISDVLDSVSDSRSVEISDELDSVEEDEFLKKMAPFMDYGDGPAIVSTDLSESAIRKDAPFSMQTGDTVGKNALPPINPGSPPNLDFHTMRIPRLGTYDMPEMSNSQNHGLDEAPNLEVRNSDIVAAEDNETSDKYSLATETSYKANEAPGRGSDTPGDLTITEQVVDECASATETPGLDNLYTLTPETRRNDQIFESEFVRPSEDTVYYPTEALKEDHFRQNTPSKRSAREDVLPSRRKPLSSRVGGSDQVREIDDHPQLPRDDIRFSEGNMEIFTTDEPLLAEEKPPLEYASNSTSLYNQSEAISERTDLESVEEDNGTSTLNKNHSVSKKDDPMNTLEYLTENTGNGDDTPNPEIVIKSLPEDIHPLEDSMKSKLDKENTNEHHRVRRNSDDTDPLLESLLKDSKKLNSTPDPLNPTGNLSATSNLSVASNTSSIIDEPIKLPSIALQRPNETLPTTEISRTTLVSTSYVPSTTSTPLPRASTANVAVTPSTYEPLPTPIPESFTTSSAPLTSTPPPTNSTTPKKKKKKVWNIPYYPHNIAISSDGEVRLEPKNKSIPLPPTTTAKPFVRNRIKPEDLQAARERLLRRFQSRRTPVIPNATLLQRSQPQASIPIATNPKSAPTVPAATPSQSQVSEDLLAYMTAQNPSQLPSLLYNSPEEREEARRQRLRTMVGLAGDVRSFLSDRAKHAMYTVGRIVGGDEPQKSKPT